MRSYDLPDVQEAIVEEFMPMSTWHMSPMIMAHFASHAIFFGIPINVSEDLIQEAQDFTDLEP